MALDPELLKRRKRIEMPRAPLRSLQEQVKGLGTADETLEKLLGELVALADRETVFTSTLERDRLLSALGYGGYCFGVGINVENQLAPGATVTTYIPVAPGFVYIPIGFEYWNSLPWWLTTMVWSDSDLPAPPATFFIRTPDHLTMNWTSIARVQRFMRYTVTNNHVANTANLCAFHIFNVVTLDTWRMIEQVYFKPLVDYVRDKAEKLSGRPYP